MEFKLAFVVLERKGSCSVTIRFLIGPSQVPGKFLLSFLLGSYIGRHGTHAEASQPAAASQPARQPASQQTAGKSLLVVLQTW